MKLYRFSPIKSEINLFKAIDYILDQSQKLAIKVIDVNLPFSGKITVCTHYFEEYTALQPILHRIGTFDLHHNGDRVILTKPIMTLHGTITHVRLREPDPYRFQVGAGDFKVDDYVAFKTKYLRPDNPYLREIIRPDLTMLEFWHPDFDVAAYIVKK